MTSRLGPFEENTIVHGGVIEIVVSTSNSLFDRLARRLGGVVWTHCGLRFPTDWCAEGHPDDYHIIETGFRHGVVERPWDASEYAEYAIYQLKGGCPRYIYDWTLAFARGQIGKRYYFEGLALIIARMLQKVFRPAMIFGWNLIGTGQTCASLVDETFKYAGIDLIETEESSLVLPDQIAESQCLELIELNGAVAIDPFREEVNREEHLALDYR